jgi:hypothetical protein
VLYLAAGLFLGSLTGCWRAPFELTVEYADVHRFSVEELGSQGDCLGLRLSGLVMHSAMTVARVRELQEGDALVLLVVVEPRREGRTGSILHPVCVPAGIDRVLFGTSRVEVWRRPGSQPPGG